MALQLLERAARETSEDLVEEALTRLSQKLLKKLIHCLEELCLPDYQGHSTVLISTLNYSTSDVHIGKLAQPESLVTIEGSKICWNVKNIGLSGIGNWMYSYLCIFGGDGTFELSATSIAATAIVEITNENGNLGVKLMECKCTLGEVEFDFKTGETCSCSHCLYQSLVKPKLYETVIGLLRKSLEKVMEDIVPFLNKIQKYWPVPFDLSFLSHDKE